MKEKFRSNPFKLKIISSRLFLLLCKSKPLSFIFTGKRNVIFCLLIRLSLRLNESKYKYICVKLFKLKPALYSQMNVLLLKNEY